MSVACRGKQHWTFSLFCPCFVSTSQQLLHDGRMTMSSSGEQRGHTLKLLANICSGQRKSRYHFPIVLHSSNETEVPSCEAVWFTFAFASSSSCTTVSCPLAAACIKEVSSFLSAASTSAPACSYITTTDAFRVINAAISAVYPILSSLFTIAPARRVSCTTEQYPPKAAACKAPFPSLFWRLTLAPDCNSSWTMLRCIPIASTSVQCLHADPVDSLLLYILSFVVFWIYL